MQNSYDSPKKSSPSGTAQTPDQDQPDRPPATGLFTANPTGIAGIVLFMLILVAAMLQYTGRYDFREIPEKVRNYWE